MKPTLTKIPLILIILTLLTGCSVTNQLEPSEQLLTKNRLYVDDIRETNDTLKNLLLQKPNKRFLGIPTRVYLYQWAKEDTDSLFEAWLDKKPKRRKRMNAWFSKKQVTAIKNAKVQFQDWKKRTGEAPAIIDSLVILQSVENLKTFQNNKGYFDAKADFEIQASKNNKQLAHVEYRVAKGIPFYLDSISTSIASPVIDSIYQLHKNESFLKKGNQFDALDFDKERDRLYRLFRNSGVYNFQLNSVLFEVAWDTVGNDYLLPVLVKISDFQKSNPETGTVQIPYQLHTIKEVNIFTDERAQQRMIPYSDSVHFNNYIIYSKGKLRYKPKTLGNASTVKKGDYYSDLNRTTTFQGFSRLQSFLYPSISYQYINNSETDLIANILLTPKDRYSLKFGFDLTHSNIQDLGIAFENSLISRNVFRGAETLEMSVRGTIGKSGNETISEIGADIQISIPRVVLPFKLNTLIPPSMSPSTRIDFGTGIQKNIGLDRQNFTAGISLNWKPNRFKTFRLGLLNFELVNNRNTQNYFNVYNSSFSEINRLAQNENPNPNYLDASNNLIIPNGINSFINDVLNQSLAVEANTLERVRIIDERKTRLTQNNLIIGSTFNYTKSDRKDLLDENYSQFRLNFELAGSLLNALSSPLNLETDTASNQLELFEVVFSQYAKTEIDYIHHWQLSEGSVLAMRSFIGLAVPFGNSNSIPFSKSYFSGGSNDNRAWDVYRLGPGSSGGINEFNEANFKLAFNLEYRFDLFGSLEGALFTDVGNIWNVFDNDTDPKRNFGGFDDLNELAIGSGFGLRYDFNYLVLRLDAGFKTYNPALEKSARWNTQYKLKDAVFNIGINYPF